MLDWIFNNPIKIIIILCIVSVIFIIIGHVYHEEVQSVLKTKIGTVPECTINFWSVLHFLLFAVFGFIMPHHALKFFILGGVFELIEDYLAPNSDKQYADCTISTNPDGTKKFWCNGIEDDYWYSNPSDWWVNLVGYAVGEASREIVKKI